MGGERAEGSTVYLVGAGPGDERLITVRGLELLERADVVVYDYLSSEGLLAHAPEGARLVYVGKRGFGEHLGQEEINALLVRLAREGAGHGRVIVRLKGGDPFVFGRGGEEALALAAAGVPFEVVPGVTAGIAAPAYAGIPVTHRKLSSSVTLVTGREDPTRDASGVDWASLAGLASRGGTVCFYMGVRSLPTIAERLVGAGLEPSTPAAAVRWGTTPAQRTLVATVGTIVREASAQGLAAPAIILVGETVALRERIAWFERAPLLGRTVLCTRAAGQEGELGAGLRDLGARALSIPMISVGAPDSYGPLDAAIGRIEAYDWVVFTSANGVRRFFGRLRETHGRDARALGRARVAAIGPATARQLGREGIVPDVVPAFYRAEGVFEAMRDSELGRRASRGREALAGARALEGERVLIPRAQVAREALPRLLRSSGARVDVAPAYRTAPPGPEAVARLREALEGGGVDAITFTSSSTARNLVAALGDEAPRLLEGVGLFSIGPVTSATMREAGLVPTAQAESYTIVGLLEAMRDHYAAAATGRPAQGG